MVLAAGPPAEDRYCDAVISLWTRRSSAEYYRTRANRARLAGLMTMGERELLGPLQSLKQAPYLATLKRSRSLERTQSMHLVRRG